MKWHHLERHLDPLAQRQRTWRNRRALAICWVVGLVVAGALWALGVNSIATLPALVGVLIIAAVLAVRRANDWRPDYQDLARRIERDNPDLHAVLLTALEQEPDPKTGELNFLQQRVINEALAEARKGHWIESVPAARLARAAAFQWVALIAMLALFTQLVSTGDTANQSSASAKVKLLEVLPGEITLERNAEFTVQAKFKGEPGVVQVALTRSGKTEHIAMTPGDGAGMMRVTMSAGQRSFTYRVEFGAGKSEEFKATVASPAELAKIEPGDTEVERGSSLAFLAEFVERTPPDAQLIIQPAKGKARSINMARNLQDPVFGATLPEVNQPLTYWVEYGEKKSKAYKVGVYEHPQLESADAKLTYPKYTGRKPREQKDVRRLTAVAGTQLEYTMHLNKPVAQARLVAADDSMVIELKTNPKEPVALLPGHVLSRTGVYKLELVDAAKRQNKYSPQFEFVVQRNLPPKIRLVFPRGDQKVSPLEEVLFEAEMEDDYGLLRYGLSYNIGGGEMRTIELGHDAPANTKQSIASELALEELGVKVDQLINYYFWAEDHGDEGQVRRTFGDMFFAEVRPFEEIFREGQAMASNQQQQQQGQKKGSQQTEELIKLQKQIINATWKLIRRETGTKPSARFAADALTVQESQQQALQKGEVLLDKSSDEKTHKYVEAVVEHMQRALDELTKVTGEISVTPLPSALAAEQAAYQALLKLQAHEHRVARGNPKQSGGQPGKPQGNRAQQQLDQLQLKQTENKYAAERQAQKLQDPKQRENLQALNRLKELAQRQKDLSEKLKEMQQALREAKTEAEKEEIRRQLKQLRDEQKENVEDADKLAQRMDNKQNRSEMKESRKQLEETRQQMNQAADQLQKGEVSKALANSTKAQKDLQKMRDEFRKKTSNQFSEQMKQMRKDARELAKDEKKLGENIKDLNERPRRSLTDSPERQKLAETAKAQGEKLENLLDDVRKTVEQSELTEPTLSRKLYDTFREAKQKQTDRALDTTAELLKRGFSPEAGELEKKAQRDINELKKGVEKAAETVLGNDTEALKEAERTLDDLAKAIKKEMNQPADKPSQKGKPSEQTGKGQPQKGKPSEQAGKGKNQPGQKGQPGRSQEQTGRKPGSFLDQIKQQNQPQRPGPITGGGENWTDQLRDVEETVEVPGVAEKVSKARDQIRSFSREFKRHSKKPQWDLVEKQVLNPLKEARERILEELARRDDQPTLAPIDRDPAPNRFIDAVKRYTEQLGRGD